jgi:hypothetical protein
MSDHLSECRHVDGEHTGSVLAIYPAAEERSEDPQTVGLEYGPEEAGPIDGSALFGLPPGSLFMMWNAVGLFVIGVVACAVMAT